MHLENCIKVTKGVDIVFNLLEAQVRLKLIMRDLNFMMSNLYCATNLLMGAQRSKVKHYLYTSTYGVYGPQT